MWNPPDIENVTCRCFHRTCRKDISGSLDAHVSAILRGAMPQVSHIGTDYLNPTIATVALPPLGNSVSRLIILCCTS